MTGAKEISRKQAKRSKDLFSGASVTRMNFGQALYEVWSWDHDEG